MVYHKHRHPEWLKMRPIPLFGPRFYIIHRTRSLRQSRRLLVLYKKVPYNFLFRKLYLNYSKVREVILMKKAAPVLCLFILMTLLWGCQTGPAAGSGLSDQSASTPDPRERGNRIPIPAEPAPPGGRGSSSGGAHPPACRDPQYENHGFPCAG